jgi:hypothetical protein
VLLFSLAFTFHFPIYSNLSITSIYCQQPTLHRRD